MDIFAVRGGTKWDVGVWGGHIILPTSEISVNN